MDEYKRVFKYIYGILVYVFSTALMYIKNTEMVGFSISTITSLILYAFLILEIAVSPKSGDLVVFVFILAIMANGVAAIFCMVTFIDLYWRYNKQGLPLQMSSHTRSILTTYEGWVVAENVLLLVLGFLFFTLYKGDNIRTINKYNPFFLTQFQKGSELVGLTFLGFKGLLSIAVVSISFYLFYLAYQLTFLIKRPLYTTLDNGTKADISGMLKNDNGAKGYTIGNPSIFPSWNDITKMLSLNYLVNYKIYLW
jgi:hypothetical protein